MSLSQLVPLLVAAIEEALGPLSVGRQARAQVLKSIGEYLNARCLNLLDPARPPVTGVTGDEADVLLDALFELVSENLYGEFDPGITLHEDRRIARIFDQQGIGTPLVEDIPGW